MVKTLKPMVINFRCVCMLSHVQLCNPKDDSPQAPLSMEFSRQECWNGLPFPPPGTLPNPQLEPASLASPASQADSLPLCHLGRHISSSYGLWPNYYKCFFTVFTLKVVITQDG